MYLCVCVCAYIYSIYIFRERERENLIIVARLTCHMAARRILIYYGNVQRSENSNFEQLISIYKLHNKTEVILKRIEFERVNKREQLLIEVAILLHGKSKSYYGNIKRR